MEQINGFLCGDRGRYLKLPPSLKKYPRYVAEIAFIINVQYRDHMDLLLFGHSEEAAQRYPVGPSCEVTVVNRRNLSGKYVLFV